VPLFVDLTALVDTIASRLTVSATCYSGMRPITPKVLRLLHCVHYYSDAMQTATEGMVGSYLWLPGSGIRLAA